MYLEASNGMEWNGMECMRVWKGRWSMAGVNIRSKDELRVLIDLSDNPTLHYGLIIIVVLDPQQISKYNFDLNVFHYSLQQ